MRGPLEFVPDQIRRPLFVVLLLWTLALSAIMQVINQPLITPAAPAGIVSLELAGTPQRAWPMVSSWEAPSGLGFASFDTANALLAAAFGLGLDYLFMPSYAVTLALGVMLAAGRRRGWLSEAGAWVGWLALAAAGFDAVENIGLWNVLQLRAGSSPWPEIAAACAWFKFAFIGIGILYAVAGGLRPRAHK